MKRRHSLRVWLDVIATIALIAASVAVIWSVVNARAAEGRASRGTSVTTEELNYKAGEKFPSIRGLNTPAGTNTVVLYLRSTCPYCTASMEFYRRLSKQRRAVIAVVGTESPELLKGYVESHGFFPDSILSVAQGDLRLTGTPTLVVLRSDRTIDLVFRGQLGPKSEQDVLDRLR